jgi:hypothetical protein
MFSFSFKCFLLCFADQVRPPPSFGSWFDTLHMWLAFRPHGDLLPLLRPWWVEDYIPLCHLGCFCVDYKRCKVSCFAGINPHFSTAFSSIFLLAGWHCSINWWHLHIGQCHHCQPHSNKLRIMGGCNSDSLSEGRILSWPLLDICVSSFCHRGFWVCSLVLVW